MQNNKIKIREALILARSSLDPSLVDKYSHIISDKIYKFITYNYNHEIIIAVYYPHSNEVDLRNLYNILIDEGYILALPAIKTDKLEFIKWEGLSLKSGKYNIMEPEFGVRLEPDIIIIPGVAYDMSFNRIGFGKGYYDRTLYQLKSYKKILTIAPCYSFQIIDEIIHEEHDHPIDVIVTENEIIFKN